MDTECYVKNRVSLWYAEGIYEKQESISAGIGGPLWKQGFCGKPKTSVWSPHQSVTWKNRVSLREAEFLFGKHKSISAGSRESVKESECRGFLWEAKDLCEQRIFHIYEKQSTYLQIWGTECLSWKQCASIGSREAENI
jgi:hypothetical protein